MRYTGTPGCYLEAAYLCGMSACSFLVQSKVYHVNLKKMEVQIQKSKTSQKLRRIKAAEAGDSSRSFELIVTVSITHNMFNNWRAPWKGGVCAYFVAIFQVARNPLKFGMPTLFASKNVPLFFSTSGETRLQICFWKSTPPSPMA